MMQSRTGWYRSELVIIELPWEDEEVLPAKVNRQCDLFLLQTLKNTPGLRFKSQGFGTRSSKNCTMVSQPA